jgi:hypothetical protein
MTRKKVILSQLKLVTSYATFIPAISNADAAKNRHQAHKHERFNNSPVSHLSAKRSTSYFSFQLAKAFWS